MIPFLLLSLAAVTLATPRATLSLSTRLRLLLTGAVVGALTVPLVRLLAGGHPLFLALLSFAVLTLPALVVLSPRHRLRFSVADGYLLGFLAGLGYDVYNLALGPPVPYALFPLVNGQPWTGYAPGCGLAGLALVAGRRFTLNPSGAWVWWLLALLLSAADRMPLTPHSPLILPAFSLLLALAAGEREQQWLKRSPVYSQLRDLSDLRVPAFSSGVVRWLRASRRRRQVMLERAELVKMGNITFFALPPALSWVTPPDLPALCFGLVAWLCLLFFPRSYGDSLLALVMPAAVILWCFLRLPELEPEDPDRVACTRLEELVVNGSVALLLLSLVAGVASGGPLPPVYPPADYALLVAMAACTLTGSQRAEARAIHSPRERRLNLVHRGLLLAKMAGLALGCGLVFGAFRAALAPILSDALPPWSVLPSQVVALALLGGLAAGLLNRLGDRVEGALCKPPSAS